MIAGLLLLTVGEALSDDPFPHSAVDARQCWQAACDRWSWLREHELPDAVGMALLRDAEFRRDCWDKLDNVKRCCGSDESCRQRNLGALRFLLGEENFAEGRMPSPLPHTGR